MWNVAFSVSFFGRHGRVSRGEGVYIFWDLPNVLRERRGLPKAEWGHHSLYATLCGTKNVYSGNGVMLYGSASDPDGDPIVSWRWRLEAAPAGSLARIDDITSKQTIFLADLAGEYVVSLRVSDGTAWSLPDYAVITAADNLPPTAQILSDVTSGTAPLPVNFDGSQSSDPETGPLYFQWDFGDSSTSNDAAPSHEFANPGGYTVSLTVY